MYWLSGDKVALGPFAREFVPQYWRWESDPRAMLGYGQQHPQTMQTRDEVFTIQSQDGNPYFTIHEVATGEPIGMSHIIVDHRTRTGELVILLGEKWRGKGFATEATRLTLDYGFHITNLRNIYLSVLAPNAAGIRAYTNAGFKEMGRRRRSGYWLGEIVDHVFMDAIPEDFPGPSVIKRRFVEAL